MPEVFHGKWYDMVTKVTDAKGVSDELRHSPCRPDVATIPVGFCSLSQEQWQLCSLF